jgi:hypothetical protein
LASEPATSPGDVFINCPFDEDYRDLFQALIFVIFACGFRARSARELDDGTETRIEKLYRLIEACRYGIHDLSRTQLDPVHELPRFNMPLELGLFLGAKRWGGRKQKEKRQLIFDIEPYRYQRFISDLAGIDIHAHHGEAERAIVETRDWLGNVSRRELPGGQQLITLHRQFLQVLPDLATELGVDPQRPPYVDFERMLTVWLLPK